MINPAVRNSIRGAGRQAYPHQVARALPRAGLLLYLGRPNLEAADAPIGDDTIIRWMFLLPADADIRAATGWVSGVGNIFYDAAGDPVAVLASEIAAWSSTHQWNVLFHLVSADTETGRLAIYAAATVSLATLTRAYKVLREDQNTSGVTHTTPFIDQIGANTRTLYGLQYIHLSEPTDFTNASITGTETVTSKPAGTATITVASGKLTVGAGDLWSFALSNGSTYEFGTILTATTGVVFDTSGNGRHLLFTVADTSAVCLGGREKGSDHTNMRGWTASGPTAKYQSVVVPENVTDYRVATRPQNGASVGYTKTFTLNSDLDFSYLPPDTQTLLAPGKWYFTDDTVGSSFVGFPFPATAGRYYEIFARFYFEEDRGLLIPIRAGMHYSFPILASGGDYEASCGKGGANVRLLYKALSTQNLFFRLQVSDSSNIFELIVSEVFVKEYIPIDKQDSIDSNIIAFYGDSITAGAYPYYTRKNTINSPGIYVNAVGGATSSAIKTNMLLATSYHKHRTIICSGSNDNYTTYPDDVLSNIKAMVDALPHDNYLILSPLGSNAVTNGTESRIKLNYVKAALASAFGDKYIDIEQALIDAYDPSNVQDVIDVANGISPSSLRGDTIHPNYDGAEVIATTLFANSPDFFTFAPVSLPQYPGRAKFNITPVSHPFDTTLTTDHTYSLADSHQIRTALGWTWGVDHWAFTSAGVPKIITGATILANGTGPNIWANADQVTILA